jgi:ubiquinone/menaquinone biosynthesis C-methylase UbiE
MAPVNRGDRVLDIGSGLGGLVRYLASEVGCRVTGLDLTPEYIALATEFTALTGLSDKAEFTLGSALSLPFADAAFSAAVTFHVGMNIADRETKYREACRVLQPGGKLVIYDVLKGPEPGMRFPVPWAETQDTSHLVAAADLRRLLIAAGFTIWTRKTDAHRVETSPRKVPRCRRAAAIGVAFLQGNTAKLKSRNMIDMAEAGQIVLAGDRAKAS